jgi:hypothetical protein
MNDIAFIFLDCDCTYEDKENLATFAGYNNKFIAEITTLMPEEKFGDY